MKSYYGSFEGSTGTPDVYTGYPLDESSFTKENIDLKLKVKNLKVWLIILCVVIVALIVFFSLMLKFRYDDIAKFKNNYNEQTSKADDYGSKNTELNDKVSNLQKEIDTLKKDKENLQDAKSDLESDKRDLEQQVSDLEDTEEKANWFGNACRIVVADSGSLYKTYHKYECDKWRSHSYWIYNKEQVINKSEFTKCTSCN